MVNKIRFTPPFLLLCIALFSCRALSSSFENHVVGNDNSMMATNLNIDENVKYNPLSGKQADWFNWFYRGMHPFLPWPVVHPPLPAGPLPSGGFPKFQWPFVHPPLPSGGFRIPPLFPWHPWIPPHLWHPHGATQNADIDGRSPSAIDVSDGVSAKSTNPKCLSTFEVVESCMQKSSLSYSWGYIFSPDCCKAITKVSNECRPEVIPMIKDQCLNKATAPPPIAS